MSDAMSIFHAGMEHVHRQRDLEKSLIVEADKSGDGPRPLDLDSGAICLVMPARPAAEQAAPADGLGPQPSGE
ncbi:MAG: hypothetical protein QM713_13200 [Arachnia sp.]